MAKKFTVSPEQRQERLRAAQQQLESGVEDIRSAETFRAYLNAMSHFHQYSWGNTMLIWMQRPDATRCASYTAWQALGRQVRKGETGIKIFAPMKYSRELTDEEKVEHFGTADIEAKASGIRGFTVVSTFDISQTDGEPLPPSPAQLLAETEGGDDLLAAVTAAATGLEFEVKDFTPADPNNPCNGYFTTYAGDPTPGTIAVRRNRSNAQQAKTTIHEMAHGLNDAETVRAGKVDNGWTRSAAELVAEGTAYVVCSALGLDTAEYSFGYLATWQGSADMMRYCADTIQRLAHRILDAIEGAALAAAPENLEAIA